MDQIGEHQDERRFDQLGGLDREMDERDLNPPFRPQTGVPHEFYRDEQNDAAPVKNGDGPEHLPYRQQKEGDKRPYPYRDIDKVFLPEHGMNLMDQPT